MFCNPGALEPSHRNCCTETLWNARHSVAVTALSALCARDCAVMFKAFEGDIWGIEEMLSFTHEGKQLKPPRIIERASIRETLLLGESAFERHITQCRCKQQDGRRCTGQETLLIKADVRGTREQTVC